MTSEHQTTRVPTPAEARERAEIAAAVAEEARRHAYSLLTGNEPGWRRTQPVRTGQFTVIVEYQP